MPATLIGRSPVVLTSSPVHFPDEAFRLLTIRVDSVGTTDIVIIKTQHGDEVSATNADIYLKNGEAIDILGPSVRTGKDVTIMASSGSPTIYWHQE